MTTSLETSNPNDVKILSVEKLDATGVGTIRFMVEIKGHLFKRLFHPYYPPVWHDEHGTFNKCLAMTPEQEKDLEGIFMAYVIENNLTDLMPKKLSDTRRNRLTPNNQ